MLDGGLQKEDPGVAYISQHLEKKKKAETMPVNSTISITDK